MTGPEAPTPQPAPATWLTADTRPFIERIGIPPILFGYLCVVAFFFIYQIVGGVAGFLVYGGLPNPSQVNGYRALTAGSQLLLLLLPALLLTRLASTQPREFLRVNPARWAVYLVPLVGVFALQNMLQVYMAFQDMIPVPGPISDTVRSFRSMIEEAYRTLLRADSPAELALVVLVIAIVPAFAEEFAFRGVVQRSFEKAVGPAKGIMLTGLIFGAFHLNPFSIIPLIVLGCYLGFLAYRAGSIWVSVLAHFFNNFILTVGLYFNVISEDSLVTGDPTELSFSMLMATFLVSGVIFFLSTVWFLRLTGHAGPASAVVPSAAPGAAPFADPDGNGGNGSDVGSGPGYWKEDP